jgi:hypothetical protein
MGDKFFYAVLAVSELLEVVRVNVVVEMQMQMKAVKAVVVKVAVVKVGESGGGEGGGGEGSGGEGSGGEGEADTSVSRLTLFALK